MRGLSKQAAKFQIMVFLAATFALSTVLYTIIIAKVGTINTVWTLALMWVPGLVGVACSKIFGHEPLRDLGLRSSTPKWLIVAYAVPAIAAILVLVISVLGGIGEFEIGTIKQIVNKLVFAPTLGVIIAVIVALGEELGWRGFLYARIHDWDIEHPFFTAGVIWAVWHWPLIFFSDYSTSNAPGVSVALFTIVVTAFSIFLGQLRRISRSIWAPTLAHAAHNVWIQTIYPSFYKAGALNPFFGGESGVILAVIYLLLAIRLQKRPLR